MKKDYTNEQYKQYAEKKSPPPNTLWQMLLAFLFGGGVCLGAEGIYKLLVSFDIPKDAAKSWLTIILIFISALLTAIGVFDKIANVAGAGVTIPITGFANAVASTAMENRSEGFIVGVGTKMFTVAGPVVLYGAVASFVAGVVYYFLGKS